MDIDGEVVNELICDCVCNYCIIQFAIFIKNIHNATMKELHWQVEQTLTN